MNYYNNYATLFNKSFSVYTVFLGAGRELLGHLSPSSALKFFVASLPLLTPDKHVCLRLLLCLLPVSEQEMVVPANPLFDEDPVNDYVEQLVLMEYLVQTMESVIAELIKTKEISLEHYENMSRHMPAAQLCMKGKGSLWENSQVFLNVRKARLLCPLLAAISEVVEGCDSSSLEELVGKIQL